MFAHIAFCSRTVVVAPPGGPGGGAGASGAVPATGATKR